MIQNQLLLDKGMKAEYNRRLMILKNLVEGTKVPRKKAQKEDNVDRNLLKKLPQNNGDLEIALYEFF